MCRLNKNLWKSGLNVQYFHMLGLPLSSTSSVLLPSGEVPHYNIYSNLCRASFNKPTPIYIVRQCICFTLVEFYHQIDLKTKILEIYLLYQFRGVLPKIHPNCNPKFTKIFIQTPSYALPKSQHNRNTIWWFFSIISINFNKNAKFTIRIILPTAKHLSLETHVVLSDSKWQLNGPCLISIHRGVFIGV